MGHARPEAARNKEDGRGAYGNVKRIEPKTM